MGKITQLLRLKSQLIGAALLFIFVFILVLLATPAEAQMSRAALGKLLLNRYAEQPTYRGLANNGGVLEIFSTQNGDTWTIVLTMPDGKSRVIGSGESWVSVTPKFGSPIYYRTVP